jgi:hypothetical protein
MQDKHTFEYAIIRLVPKVEREEFLNIGVIVFCAKLKYLKVQFTTNETRIKAFAPLLDIEEVKEHMQSFAKITHGSTDAGPIGRLDAAARFRWLTAIRSTIIQPSRIHPGLCTADIDKTFERLFEQQIGQ